MAGSLLFTLVLIEILLRLFPGLLPPGFGIEASRTRSERGIAEVEARREAMGSRGRQKGKRKQARKARRKNRRR